MQLAGIIGVHPGAFTLRELAVMSLAKQRSDWNRTSASMALFANANRDPKRGRPFKPSDFDPYARQDRRERTDVDRESLATLKEALTGRKGNEHGR